MERAYLSNSLENVGVKVTFLKESEGLGDYLSSLGFPVRAVEPNREADLPFWAAIKLQGMGLCKIHESEDVEMAALVRAHWREAVASEPRQMTELRPSFYLLTRHLLRRLLEEGKANPGKAQEYNKAMALFQDLVSCRLRKLMNLASVTAGPPKGLTVEEAFLFDKLRNLVEEWKGAVLDVRGSK